MILAAFPMFQNLTGPQRQLIALGLLALAAVIGSLSYETSFLFFFTRQTSYIPDLMAGLVAILALRPVIVGRFYALHRLDLLTLVGLALAWYVVAVLCNIGLVAGSFGIGAFKTPLSLAVLGMLAVANWNPQRFGGMLFVSSVVIGAFILTVLNDTMGILGYLMVVATVVAALLMVDLPMSVERARHGVPALPDPPASES